MKNQKILLLLVGIIIILSIHTILAEDALETAGAAATSDVEWYVQIIDGTLLNSADPGTESIIVPREIMIVSKSEALIDSSSYHLIALNQRYQDVRDYINNYLKVHPEKGVKVTGVAVSSKVFREWLEFNKQQTAIWGPYDQIKVESEKLYSEYQIIENNLKLKRLYIEPDSYVSKINLTIIVGGKDYFLKLDTININNTVKFNSFLLNGTNDLITLSELNKNNKDKQINITLLSKKPSSNYGFYLKNITMYNGTTIKVDLPFKSLKSGEFEIKSDILYSAILKTENIPYATDVYYYLPQGFVVFPDEKGQIQVNFFRKGTIKQPAKDNFEGYDYVIRDSIGWISATCSCNCKTLFKDPTAIRTTATEIKEIYLGENADFYYAIGKGMMKPTEPLNHIRSFGVGNAEFSSSKFTTARTHIVFEENWDLRFVGKGSTSSSTGIVVQENNMPHFYFNGVEIQINPGVGAINTQLRFTSKAQGTGYTASYISGKAALSEKAPISLTAIIPGKDPYSAKLTFLNNQVTKEIAERTIVTNSNVDQQYAKVKATIIQAKTFEQNLKPIEIEIPTPVAPALSELKTSKTGIGIKPQVSSTDLCSTSYSGYKCTTFMQDITIDSIKAMYAKAKMPFDPEKSLTSNQITYTQTSTASTTLAEQRITFTSPPVEVSQRLFPLKTAETYTCITTRSCQTSKDSPKDQYCCPGGYNVRCCKAPPAPTSRSTTTQDYSDAGAYLGAQKANLPYVEYPLDKEEKVETPVAPVKPSQEYVSQDVKNQKLLYAIEKSNLDLVNQALDQGADPNTGARFDFGVPLWSAYMYSFPKDTRLKIMQTLIDHGAKVFTGRGTGEPFHIAVYTNNQESIDFFINNNYPINQRGNIDGTGYTPLHDAAIWGGNLETIKKLIEHGAKINALGDYNRIPLHNAARRDSKYEADAQAVVLYLISQGANVNAQDDNKQTPLHLAMWSYIKDRRAFRLLVVQTLLAKGANPDLKDNDGNTARELAKRYNLVEISSLNIQSSNTPSSLPTESPYSKYFDITSFQKGEITQGAAWEVSFLLDFSKFSNSVKSGILSECFPEIKGFYCASTFLPIRLKIIRNSDNSIVVDKDDQMIVVTATPAENVYILSSGLIPERLKALNAEEIKIITESNGEKSPAWTYLLYDMEGKTIDVYSPY